MTQIKALIQRLLALPWVRFAMNVGQRFGEDNGGLFAAGLAFFLLLSFAPLLLTSVALTAFFIHDPANAAHVIRASLQGLFPAGPAQVEINHFLTDRINVSQQVNRLVKGRSIAGVFGLLTLVWTSMQIFINASSAMNAAFETKESRSWVKLRVVALSLLICSGFLLIVSLGLSAAPGAIYRFGHKYIPLLPVPLWLLTMVFEVVAVAANALLYVLIYRFLPSSKVDWRSAVVGGLFASVGWEVAKKLLAEFILRPNTSVYGGLASLIVLILWLYYSMMILLFGAEVAAQHQSGAWRRPSVPAAGEKRRALGDGRRERDKDAPARHGVGRI